MCLFILFNIGELHLARVFAAVCRHVLHLVVAHSNIFVIVVTVICLNISQLHIKKASIGVNLFSLYLEASYLYWLVSILLGMCNAEDFAHCFVETGVLTLG